MPFMNSTTSLALTSFSMNFSMAMDLRSCWAAPRAEGGHSRLPAAFVADICSAKWRLPKRGWGDDGPVSPAKPPKTRPERAPGVPGLQRQGVQHAAHLALERLVDQLVLLDPGFALERGGHTSPNSGRRPRRDRGSSLGVRNAGLISRSISPASIAIAELLRLPPRVALPSR